MHPRRYALVGLIALVVTALVVMVAHEQTREHVTKTVQSMTAKDYRENAVFVTLCRNDDLDGMLSSISHVNHRFNDKFGYDWIFLNEEPFSDVFKQQVSEEVKGKAKFGVVPKEHWSYPEWIDQDKAAETRKAMKKAGVRYGGLESYRHMCRFYSGFFYKHPLLKPYKYYWRVEPGIQIKCTINYDVFTLMRQGNYKYGWTVAPKDIPETIETLWPTTLDFLANNSDYVATHNLRSFLSDDNGVSYNTCHFWSNFEIADLDFWRSDAYQAYFDYLDHSGGFFYERWGDAPVHSIAASLFLDSDEIHFFDDIGYFHDPYGHCPINQGIKEIKCSCHPSALEFSDTIYDWHENSCVRNYLSAKSLPYVDGNEKFQKKN